MLQRALSKKAIAADILQDYPRMESYLMKYHANMAGEEFWRLLRDSFVYEKTKGLVHFGFSIKDSIDKTSETELCSCVETPQKLYNT